MALPRSLPPPPSASSAPVSAPVKPFDALAHFLNMRNSYLDMLETPSSSAPSAEPAVLETAVTAAAVPAPLADESLELSPELRELLEFVSPEFATPLMGGSDSPLEETPLFTPMLDFGTPISNVWEPSPAFGDSHEFPPLFATAVDTLCLSKDTTETMSPADLMNTLYTMPTTPALAPVPLFPDTPATAAKLNAPNGHRKGVSATNLIPIDAPTQLRNYYTESKTSRKAVPAAFVTKAKKRTREEAGFPVDDDDDVLLTPDLEDAIATKRRQNTIAARRSRARKAETARQQDELISALTDENARLRLEVEQLRSENEALRRRVAH